MYPEVTEAFINLSNSPSSVSEEDFNHLQRYVILLYDRTNECNQLNEARKVLFAKGRQLERIPPTEAALVEHIKRAAYQGGHCWGQSLIPIQNLPSPADWGWIKDSDGQWMPYWTALPEAAKSCKELIKCGCRKACRPPCKCSKASLPCTELCNCAGSCFQ